LEEDSVELIDYLRVIWRRKGLIIVGTLLSMVATGVVSFTQPRFYRAEALIEIGRVLKTPFPNPSLAPVESSADMVQSIAFRHGVKEREGPSYPPARAKVVKGTSLIKIIQEGPDREMVANRLERVVDEIVSNHNEKVTASFSSYKELIGTLEDDLRVIKGEIVSAEKVWGSLEHKVDNPVTAIMYKDYLFNTRKEVRSLLQDITTYQAFIKNIEEYRSKLIGDIVAEEAPVKPKIKLNILLAGMGGAMFFLFLAFLLEYIKRTRERSM